VSNADRIGYLLGAAGAALVGWFVQATAARMLLDGPWLAAMIGALAATALALALRPSGWERAEQAGLALLGGLRLAIPLALTLGWSADGRELWAAVAMLIAMRDARRGALPRWPLVPSALGAAVVIAWSAVEPRVAPGRAVLIAVACACAAAEGRRAGQRVAP
jgi:hypothetical protein